MKYIILTETTLLGINFLEETVSPSEISNLDLKFEEKIEIVSVKKIIKI